MIIKLTEKQKKALIKHLSEETCPALIYRDGASISDGCDYLPSQPEICRQCWKEAIEHNNKEVSDVG